MRPSIFLPFIAILAICFSSCRDENKAKSFEQMAYRIQQHYVADRRVDRLEIRHKSTFKGLLVEGFTTIPEAYDSIQRVLSSGGFVVANSNFRLLPDAALLKGKTAGIIKVSAANLRSKPGHSQELATQAFMGTPLQVLDFKDGWYLVRTPDRYIAWLEPGAFVAMKPAEAEKWMNGDLRVFADQPAEVTTAPGSSDLITDLLPGNLVAYENEEGDLARILLPDGQQGWVAKEGLYPLAGWFDPEPLAAENILSTARGLKGRTYLWGGTSTNAMDCSGFTKLSYYFNGYVIPRDASQQVHAGTEVALSPDFKNLEPGDLLFFGRYREDGSEKITHVGFYTGNGRFLHAGADNGRIMEQSFLPEDEDFAEHRLKSLLRARRLSQGSPGVIPVGDAFRSLLN